MEMIDISNKDVTSREAIVEGKIIIKKDVIEKIINKEIKKGDVLEAAKLAGMMAAKKTSETLPFCHPILINSVKIDFKISFDNILIITNVKAESKTGVEMEAFNAVSVACLTIYDMIKSLDKEAVISEIKLIKKSGGKNGDYERK